MWRTAYETYFEERILSADPLELVHMLYDAAINAVADARRQLAGREILARAKSVSKACDILLELNTSLDFEHGGDTSVRLSQLYGYMHRRLVEGNFRQTDEPLAEVAGLLATLLEGWEQVEAKLKPPAPREMPEQRWMPAMSSEPEMAYSGSSWSF